jgi:hypothetical protein
VIDIVVGNVYHGVEEVGKQVFSAAEEDGQLVSERFVEQKNEERDNQDDHHNLECR